MNLRRKLSPPLGQWTKRLLCGAAWAACLNAGTAFGQEPKGLFIVSYVEAPLDGIAALDGSLKTYAEQLRHAPGSPSVEILKETSRPNRFLVVERWPVGATDSDVAGNALRQAIDGKVEGPLDRRIGRPIGPLLTSTVKAPFHMVMHVDVVPDGSAAGTKAIDDQRALVLAAPGGLGFEFGAQTDKANHFAVHETWTSQAAYQTYMAGPGGRDLRKRLMEFRGAPFDDRFYEIDAGP